MKKSSVNDHGVRFWPQAFFLFQDSLTFICLSLMMYLTNSEQLSISYNGCENKVQIFFLSLYMCILSILYIAYVDLHQKGHEETEVLRKHSAYTMHEVQTDIGQRFGLRICSLQMGWEHLEHMKFVFLSRTRGYNPHFLRFLGGSCNDWSRDGRDSCYLSLIACRIIIKDSSSRNIRRLWVLFPAW